MGRLFEGLKKGMREVVAYKKGKITLKSEWMEIPEPPKRVVQPTPKNGKSGI
jgi:putative transcriptional regulator